MRGTFLISIRMQEDPQGDRGVANSVDRVVHLRVPTERIRRVVSLVAPEGRNGGTISGSIHPV